MSFTDDHILIDYFDSRIIGFRILIHHRSIGRVALSTIASIILSHHHDVAKASLDHDLITLTGRTLISITVALGLSIAVAVYMNLVLKIDPTDRFVVIVDQAGD